MDTIDKSNRAKHQISPISIEQFSTETGIVIQTTTMYVDTSENIEQVEFLVVADKQASSGGAPLKHSDNSLAIALKPAKQIAYDAQRLRVSRRLLLAKHNERMTVACPITGIVSLLDIPRIPTHTLIWLSPLSDLANCRGLAQQGAKYLQRLDMQVLCGILLVLAEDYNLFFYSGQATASENNAILRACEKQTIIKAILLIEESVHSRNCDLLPKLSLVYDDLMKQYGIESRINEWMKLLVQALFEKIEEEKEQEYTGMPRMRDLKKAYTKQRNEEKKNSPELKAKRELREDCKTAKVLIKELSSTSTASVKLRNFLTAIFTDDTILTVESVMLELIAGKLRDLNCPAAEALELLVLKERTGILMADLDELSDIEQSDTDNHLDTNEDSDNEDIDDIGSIDEEYRLETVAAENNDKDEAMVQNLEKQIESFEPIEQAEKPVLSLVERIKAKRAASTNFGK